MNFDSSTPPELQDSPLTVSKGVGLLLLFAGMGLLVYAAVRGRSMEPNPDPNHMHADFAMWIDEQKFDFSEENYMSGSSMDPNHAGAKHPYFHLHDGNGDVIHRHKPGLPVGEFFRSLGFNDECFVDGDAELPRNNFFCLRFPDNTTRTFQLYVNGELMPDGLRYIFNDMDQLLITDAIDPEVIDQQIDQLTNDACKYSQTCPGRGAPPTENCIADPAVPCME
jgi:hypothetical protein